MANREPSAGAARPRLLLGLALLCLCGAGWWLVQRFTDHNRRTMRAWGEVSYAGQPIAQGQIVFAPLDPTAGPVTGGAIVNGNYDVPAAKGPLVGVRYRVAITGYADRGRKIELAPGNFVPALDNIVPGRFNEETKLEVTISPSAPENQFNFRLAKE